MGWLSLAVGIALVLITLADVYLTVLYPGSSGPVSGPVEKGAWRALRRLALVLPSGRDRLLSFAAPTLLVLAVALWVSLLVVGFALIAWPALGTGIQSSRGPTPTDFAAALYFSGYSLTTLGTGDLVPKTSAYRLLMVLEAGVGFSVLTLTLTYYLSVYNALTGRNTFALSLHHSTGGTADAAEMLVRLGPRGEFGSARQDVSNMGNELLGLLQSHHSYSILRYFRFRQPYFALPRIALLAMDTGTLVRAALDEEEYYEFVRSTSVAQLWGGGLQLLTELSREFLPGGGPSEADQAEPGDTEGWRERYYRGVRRLQAEGIRTVRDLHRGADRYVELRREWEPYVVALAKYLAYEWDQVAPADSDYERV